MGQETPFKMTPIKLEILMHYDRCLDDYRNGDFGNADVRYAIDDLVKAKLIDPTPSKYASFVLSDRGRCYVDALLAIPLPVPVWAMPRFTVEGAA